MKRTTVKQCTKCSSKENVVPIAYGYPGPEMWKESEMGEIKLGGCGIVENAPEWYCNKCEHEF